MADVRSLLRNERTARRISHPHATYSTTGALVCLLCHIQLKSDSLWNSHLRSTIHLQRIRDGASGRPPEAPTPDSRLDHKEEQDKAVEGNTGDSTNRLSIAPSSVASKKRKADGGEDQLRKRSRGTALPEGFFDKGVPEDSEIAVVPTNGTPPTPGSEFQLPSRPATPLKASEVPTTSKATAVDEDEWAAFEADIAAAEAPTADNAIISAPAMSAEELAAKSREEEIAARKNQQDAEREGDKEDAARKLEDEFEEMQALEERIRKLKEKREALRLKDANEKAGGTPAVSGAQFGKLKASDGKAKEEDEFEEDDDDDDDDWAGFRLKG